MTGVLSPREMKVKIAEEGFDSDLQTQTPKWNLTFTASLVWTGSVADLPIPPGLYSRFRKRLNRLQSLVTVKAGDYLTKLVWLHC